MIKKSGIITICGRPNVGKSTLTNAFVGEKVAIVTNKPQTTRNRICGIKTRGESQFVFVDTPGLHKARTRLGDYMVNVVKESVSDVDAGCVHKDKLTLPPVFDAANAVAGGLGLIGDDGHLLPHKGVGQGGLAHIGPSADGDNSRSFNHKR